jgi:hypothetical protein
LEIGGGVLREQADPVIKPIALMRVVNVGGLKRKPGSGPVAAVAAVEWTDIRRRDRLPPVLCKT